MKKKLLILGATGMLGHCLFRHYVDDDRFDVYGTIRKSRGGKEWVGPTHKKRLQAGVDVGHWETVVRVVETVKPDIVINAIAMIDQSKISADPLSAIAINAQLPHQLAVLCHEAGARLVHISTDGVFDGKKGMYTEEDKINIADAYGMTKFLGEVSDKHCVTLRTSIIGHTLVGKIGLVEWLLAQNTRVRGYSKVIYSGFPTVELARIISDYVISNDGLSGVYHVSSEPISKYELLKMIASRYGKQIEIDPDNALVLNRSLDSSRFRSTTGYHPPSWEKMIEQMYQDYMKEKQGAD